MAKAQREVSEDALIWWAQRQRELNETRNGLVRQALGWGLSKHRIHVLTGIARTTIDRIIRGCDAERWEHVTHGYTGEQIWECVFRCDRGADHGGAHSYEDVEFEPSPRRSQS